MSYKHEYFVENININNINKTIKNYISEYKKNFIRFKFECRIDSTIDEFNKNNKVNLYVLFYSEKEDVTYIYYFQCPKPVIENRLLKILDTNPLLIKSLGAYLDPSPLIVYIIYKYWGRIDNINNKKKLLHYYNWYESAPNHPSQELLEYLRSH